MMSKLKAAHRLGAEPAGGWARPGGGQGEPGGSRASAGSRFEGRGSRQESFGSGSCRRWGVRPPPPGGPGCSSWRGRRVDQWWHRRHDHHVGTVFVPCSLTSGSHPG